MLTLLEALSPLEQKAELPSVDHLICILQECRKSKDLDDAKQLHSHTCCIGLEAHRVLGNYVVPMLAECGSMHFAMQVFHKLACRNEYSWSSLIQGYIEYEGFQRALEVFHLMQEDCVQQSRYTLQALLKVCAMLKYVEIGQELHAEIVKEAYENDPFVGSTLVDMYGKCGLLAEAREVLDELLVRNVISWTALIRGYAEHGFGKEALDCLELMQLEGISPNIVTILCSLKACGCIEAINRGQELHSDVVKEGFEKDLCAGNALVDMYGKCGLLTEAEDVFDELPVRDVVSWTALIMIYAENELGEEALKCLQQMKLEGVSPNDVTLAGSLKACGSPGTIASGRELHAEIVIEGIEGDLFIGSTLVDMYVKCRSLTEAQEVYDMLWVRDVVSWNILLAGYSCQGESELVLHLFQRMQEEGIRPNGVTLLSVLSACSHAGLVDKGKIYFELINKKYDISLTTELHNCMLDLLGRAGQLSEAIALVKSWYFQPDLVTWKTMLGACRKWGDVECGRQTFECAVRCDEEHGAAFILMVNMYADDHVSEDAEKAIDSDHELMTLCSGKCCLDLWMGE